MSEKQIPQPEVDVRTSIETYQQAADYLETAIHHGVAKIEPDITIADYQLMVTAEVPPLNGKRLVLQYERPKREDDPTQIDLSTPLAWSDENGRNHWHTPIRITVLEEGEEKPSHDYWVEYAGGTERVRVTDEAVLASVTDECAKMAQVDAQELIAQLEWGLDSLSSGQ